MTQYCNRRDCVAHVVDVIPPDFNARGTGYEAPEGWTLMWPGSPGPEPQESEPQFTLLDVLSGEELTFPYEIDPPG